MANCREKNLVLTGEYSKAIKLAQAYSSNSDKKLKFHMGAVLLSKDGKILSAGTNRYSISSHTKIFERNIDGYIQNGVQSVHCEVQCLSEINFNQKISKNGTILVVGYSRAGNIIKSRPCPSCYSMIRYSGIKKVIWQNKDGSFVQEDIRT